MFLNYLALAITLIGLTLVFYTFIYIHDIPYQTAKRRNHPQTEAIHLACWLSLFTLHAIWPIVFVWAVMKPQPLSVKIAGGDPSESELSSRLASLEHDVTQIKNALRPHELSVHP
ncbi:MAG: membrane protein [Alphaproteobacteria bacterium]|nr:MAG: membrane protein [Alphaproteobacteria bacterium]